MPQFRLVRPIPFCILGFCTLFLFLSLMSYSATDPSLNHEVQTSGGNMMGFAGAVLSDLLYQFFGSASWCWFFLGLAWLWRMQIKPVDTPIVHVSDVCWLPTVLVMTVFLTLYVDNPNLPAGSGGIIGPLFATPLKESFYGPVVFILLLLLLWNCLTIVLRYSLLDILRQGSVTLSIYLKRFKMSLNQRKSKIQQKKAWQRDQLDQDFPYDDMPMPPKLEPTYAQVSKTELTSPNSKFEQAVTSLDKDVSVRSVIQEEHTLEDIVQDIDQHLKTSSDVEDDVIEPKAIEEVLKASLDGLDSVTIPDEATEQAKHQRKFTLTDTEESETDLAPADIEKQVLVFNEPWYMAEEAHIETLVDQLSTEHITDEVAEVAVTQEDLVAEVSTQIIASMHEFSMHTESEAQQEQLQTMNRSLDGENIANDLTQASFSSDVHEEDLHVIHAPVAVETEVVTPSASVALETEIATLSVSAIIETEDVTPSISATVETEDVIPSVSATLETEDVISSVSAAVETEDVKTQNALEALFNESSLEPAVKDKQEQASVVGVKEKEAVVRAKTTLDVQPQQSTDLFELGDNSEDLNLDTISDDVDDRSRSPDIFEIGDVPDGFEMGESTEELELDDSTALLLKDIDDILPPIDDLPDLSDKNITDGLTDTLIYEMVSEVSQAVSPELIQTKEDKSQEEALWEELNQDVEDSESDTDSPLPSKEEASFQLPNVQLFKVNKPTDSAPVVVEDDDRERLEEVLLEYKIKGVVIDVQLGPVVTQYVFKPEPGVKINSLINLQSDLARGMGALSVRVAGNIHAKKAIGIEIPNAYRETVFINTVLNSQQFRRHQGALPLAVGVDISGRPVIFDLVKTPHLLVAGTTGSGKSVAVNTMICSLLMAHTPRELRLILIDPKMLELSMYADIPHLLVPVVTEPNKANRALAWAVLEMDRRYQIMAEFKVRSIESYNQVVEATGSKHEHFPYIVIVIDELADLMMISGKEVEQSICRIAQKARAAGIHLIVATQRPSVDVITGLIKANLPSRLSFRVSSKIDSRTVLDQGGAEQLLGYGDSLFMFSGAELIRIHGAFVADKEVSNLAEHWRQQGKPEYQEDILVGSDANQVEDADYDERFDEAVALVVEKRQCSASMIQRNLRIGYNRASRIVESMENDGIVSAPGSGGIRQVMGPSLNREEEK